MAFSLLTGVFALSVTGPVRAQVPKVRTYANFQGSLTAGTAVTPLIHVTGAITNAPLAANAVVTDASTLSVGVGLAGLASVTQYLEFTTLGTHASARTIAANTPVTFKITLPTALLSVASGLSAGYYTGLNPVAVNWPLIGTGHDAGWQATSETVVYSGATLLNALNGMGEIELTIIPPVTFNGVFFRLSGNGLALGLNSDLYHAYINENAPGTIPFAQPVDILSGVRAGTAVGGVGSATGSVTNPWNAVDTDPGPGYTTYAQLNTGAQLLSEVFHTTIFNTPCKAGDSISLILQDPGAGLIDLSLLSGFSIRLYNGNQATPVQTIDNASPLLNLRLLTGSSNIYALTAAATAAFDRIEVKMGGVAAALSSFRIYDVSAKRPSPVVPQSNVYVYAGQTAALNATITNGDAVVFYDAAVGGTALPGTTVATTNGQAGTTLNYFAGATRTGFSGGSERAPVNVHVIGFTPPAAIPTATLNVPYTASIAAAVPSPGTLPVTPVLAYAVATGNLSNLSLNAATGAITGTPNTVGTFPFTAAITDNANTLAIGSFPYTLNVQAPLPVELVSFEARAKGLDAVLNWEIANEADLAYFMVERSTNSRDFTAVGKLDRKAGESKYSYTDPAPGAPVAYYRLQMTDKDGKVDRSPTRKVVLSRAENPFFSLTPNPNTGAVHIALNDQQDIASLVIVDISGKLIVNLNPDAGTYTVPLAAGIYFVRAVGKDEGQVQTMRAVVQ